MQTVEPGDVAWVLTCTVLVLLMTIPGLALFYAGMVRKKNILATMMQSFMLCAVITLVWMIAGYSLAFGTGTHPTTALCLEWLASHDLTDKTVIDYGCGSGILAVAAILLGANSAYAVDIDPQAITATRSNALKNKVEDKIKTYLPEQFTPFQADIVLANILAKPLINMAEPICALVVSGGQLVLSGILYEQAESVISAYRHRINFSPLVQQEDWIRLEGVKL